MRFNPYMPNSPVHPGMFVGRIEEIETIEKCFNQTKYGNPDHFLIQGERGIGKSSLLSFAEGMAKGEVSLKSGSVFNFIVINVDLAHVSTKSDVVGQIGRGLKDAFRTHNSLKEKAKGVWDWVTNWEVLGVKYQKSESQIDELDAIDDIADNLGQIIGEGKESYDGVVLLIDEADTPGVKSELGRLVKYLSERLNKRGANNVLIGMAGVTGIVPMLSASHPSSPRLFNILTMEALLHSECEQVIEIGVKEANRKNLEKTTITPQAKKLIADLSEGYPHFLQQFAFSAFEADWDLEIDSSDVEEGAYRENGAMAQLGEKFFNEMYHAKINSEDYRRVLDAMAEYGDAPVKRKDIVASSGVKDTQVTNALRALKERGIILADESRPGVYRLPTKSFAVWINASKEA